MTIPQGVVGDRLPWGGERQGAGGVRQEHVSLLLLLQKASLKDSMAMTWGCRVGDI